MDRATITNILSKIYDPVMKIAREKGQFVFVYRRIIPNFYEDIHTYNPDNMVGWERDRPKHCTMYIVIDPHDAVQDAIQFWCVDAEGFLWLVYETPNWYEGYWKGTPFHQTRPEHYRVTARTIKDVIERFDVNVGGIGIDPHFASKTSKESGERVVALYNQEFSSLDSRIPHIRLVNPDKEGRKELVAGHSLIREYLDCNPEKPIEKGNRPKIMISKLCYRTIHALKNYRRKEIKNSQASKLISEEPEQAYKHWIDVMRYMISMRPAHYTRQQQLSWEPEEPVSMGVV